MWKLRRAAPKWSTDPLPTSKHLPDPAQPWLRVAHIVRPQGHRGEVLADLLTDFPERFTLQPKVLLRPPGADTPQRTAQIERWRLHAGRVVLKLTGCDTMNDAEALRSYELVIPWSERTPLAADEVYIAELLGCTLIDGAANAPVGTVIDVDRESGATALLVVETKKGELLVPFVQAYDPHWDLAERTLRMTLPEGLLDLDRAAEG